MVVQGSYIVLFLFAVLACVTLPVSVLSNYWEWTTVDVDILKQIKLQHGVQATPLVEGRLFLITKEDQAVSEREWMNNANILANTNSGLWSSCLSISDADYEATLSNLSWLGPRCMDLGDWTSPAEPEDHVARWRKTMNLSISCFITALIIITAAVMLGLIGVLYNQAACVLVDSVLFQLTVFFSVFGIAIHLYNRVERQRDLACLEPGPLCSAVSHSPGWSQALGIASVFFSAGAAFGLYTLSRTIISRSW